MLLRASKPLLVAVESTGVSRHMRIQGSVRLKRDEIVPLHKPAEVAHPIHNLMRERWSPRAFATRPVERPKLLSLFEAARWAPSGNNRQPWHFVVGASDHPED